MNELKVNPLRPKEVKDPHVRKELGELICSMIDDGQLAKGNHLQARWENCEKRYRGEPDDQGIRVNEDSEPEAINIVKPRIDALVTKVCNPITSQRPYFSAFGYANDKFRIKENEEVVQFLIERADFARLFREATRLSCQAAPAIFRVTFAIEDSQHLAGQSEQFQDVPEQFKYIGPVIDVIHPNDFVLYPLTTGGVNAARLVGHRIARRCKEVKEMQAQGIYFDTLTMYGGDDPQSWESGRSEEWSLTSEASGITDPDDQMVEIWEVLIKHDLDGDGFEERYRAVVAKTQRVLLEFEKYGAIISEPVVDDMLGPAMDPVTLEPIYQERYVPYSRPWYYPHAVTIPAHNEFFHANPITQDLIPCQAIYSDGMTLMVEGGKMSAFPTAFISGGKINDRVKRYRPGEYHYVDADVKFQFVDPKFNPTVWPILFQTIKDDADAIVRVGQNATAQTTGNTATESAIVNNNTEEGADEYRDVAAMAPEAMCDFIRELSYIHYGILVEAYGDQFPCQDANSLKSPLRWEATGKTADTNPQIMGQNIQEVLMLLSNPLALQALLASGINIAALLKGYLKTKRWPIAESDLFNEQPINQQATLIPGIGPMGPDNGVPPGPPNADAAAMSALGTLFGPTQGAGGMPPI